MNIQLLFRQNKEKIRQYAHILCAACFLCLLFGNSRIALAQESGQTHIVQPGEFLSSIAARYGVSVYAITSANGISDPNLVQPGQVLIIPPRTVAPTQTPTVQTPEPSNTPVSPAGDAPTVSPTVQDPPLPTATNTPTYSNIHVVRSGESLSAIASRYGTTYTAIMERNGLISTTVHAGQRLIIPTGGYVPQQPTATATPTDERVTPTATRRIISLPTPIPSPTRRSYNFYLPIPTPTPTPFRR